MRTRGCSIERILRDIEAALSDERGALTAVPDTPLRPVSSVGVLAAVAALLRPDGDELDLLLIKRAERPGDPWSGHMAFPGGRASPGDGSLLDTARRETLEEVGIDLAAEGRFLGPLDVVSPRRGAPPVTIHPFLFSVAADTVATPNEEVERALWIPLTALTAPEAAVEHLLALDTGETLSFPAVGYKELVIWGLTHRIMMQVLSLVRGNLGPKESP